MAASAVTVAAAVLLAVAACSPGAPAGGSAAAASNPAPSAAACPYQSSGVIGFAASGRRPEGKIVLGRISVRPGYGQPALRVGGRWPYWQKNGIEIMAGTPVVLISLPESWRQRAAITWGTSGTVSSLRLTSCARPARVWDGYAGGFYLRSAAACVPLVFRIGDRSATILFSVGRRCG